MSQWLARAREGGLEALKAHPAPGPTPRLSAKQLEQLPQLLEVGAESYGFQGDVWTHSVWLGSSSNSLGSNRVRAMRVAS